MLSLAINAAVVIGVIVQDSSIVTRFVVPVLAVTVPLPVSESINAVAPAQLISVPVAGVTALVTVNALVAHHSTELIMNLFVLHTTVSSLDVNVLIFA